MAGSQSSLSRRSLRSYPVRGALLRSLRRSLGWTQEQAAREAHASDRFIRKAEAGGPLELRSIALLAALYSTRERPLTPLELLAEQSAALPVSVNGDARHLVDWLDAIWNIGRLEAIDESADPQLSFHCELGTLNSPSEFRRRIDRIRRSFSGFCLQIHEASESGGTAACLWQMTMKHTGVWRGIDASHRQVAAWGTTTVRFQSGRIVEGWEHWDPQLAAHNDTH